jgi:hypothetical protein
MFNTMTVSWYCCVLDNNIYNVHFYNNIYNVHFYNNIYNVHFYNIFYLWSEWSKLSVTSGITRPWPEWNKAETESEFLSTSQTHQLHQKTGNK